MRDGFPYREAVNQSPDHGWLFKDSRVLPAMGRCLAHVQPGQLLSAKPNK